MRGLTAILLAMGCAACGHDRSAAAGGAGHDSAATSSPLVLLLDVPASVRAGEDVAMAVTLVNRGAAPVRVGSIAPDVVVTRGDGSEVWRRSRHEPPPAPAADPASALRPNEMRGSGYAWSQRDNAGRPMPPGTYRVRAESPGLKLVSEPRAVIIQP